MSINATRKKGKSKEDKKEPDMENVGIHKDLMLKLKLHKKKTGTSVRFFVTQAIEEKLKTIEKFKSE